MKSIHIGNVTVPLVDYAVGASAILGIRDSGKTVTSKGICEQLIDHDVQPIIFDAVGKWRWMKVPAAHSRGKGYKVVVAGGRGPDLPLTPHSVTEIVRSALKERIPLVIDLFDKNLSKADWRRIVQTAIHIIHYENENGAVHVFLEEAAEFVPQKIYDGETYAEVEKLVRMGGNASVGITLINQRSQEVNKAVLDNCSTALVLGCQVGKNAIEAVEKWIERLDPKTADELTQSLPKLKSGEAWVWTRKSLDKPSREQMPMCRSFHPDRRTPETVLKSAKSINTEDFIAKMAASIPKVIEEAKANDPAALKREVARLNRELDAKPKQVEAKPPVEVSVLTANDRALVSELISKFDALYQSAEGHYSQLLSLSKATNDLKPDILSLKRILEPPQRAVVTVRHPIHVKLPRNFGQIAERKSSESNGALGKCERAILTSLAQYSQGRTSNQCAILTGYSVNSGGFNNSLSSLRSHGYINRGQPIQITDEGMAALGDWTPLPTGEELQQHWLNRLGKCEASILRVLLAHYPQEIPADHVAEVAGYAPSSGGFNNSLSRLRTLELITRGQPMKANDDFFV